MPVVLLGISLKRGFNMNIWIFKWMYFLKTLVKLKEQQLVMGKQSLCWINEICTTINAFYKNLFAWASILLEPRP